MQNFIYATVKIIQKYFAMLFFNPRILSKSTLIYVLSKFG